MRQTAALPFVEAWNTTVADVDQQVRMRPSSSPLSPRRRSQALQCLLNYTKSHQLTSKHTGRPWLPTSSPAA